MEEIIFWERFAMVLIIWKSENGCCHIMCKEFGADDIFAGEIYSEMIYHCCSKLWKTQGISNIR